MKTLLALFVFNALLVEASPFINQPEQPKGLEL
jgi:hypothetical protein